ncbi:hypothetical protein CQW23_25720 [Capsicum baccatum]|uniref:Uncharacterized protein n=1 Tax=Capsicum baccatum TaxID=33114 RepID=A0A2G2VLS5_CAPBA|nr:hypothetical protein CQW23_25720 [Capsicum baccatum]
MSSIGDVFLSYFSGLASSGDLGDSVQIPHMSKASERVFILGFNLEDFTEEPSCVFTRDCGTESNWTAWLCVGSNLVGVDLSLGSSSASPDEHADSQDHDEQAYNQNHDGDNSDRSTLFPAIDRDRSINSLYRY